MTEAALATTPLSPATPPDPGAKLSIEKFADGKIACLRLAGTIDEAFEGKRLGATATGDVLLIDLGGVKKISSFGIREWIDFVTTAVKQVQQLILIECSPKVVDQLNMVANFTGGGRVYSFYVPFRCDYCDSEHKVLLQADQDYETIKSMKLAERPCPSCQEGMYFDEDGATYFSYMISQERFSLEDEVATFLAAKLNYAVADLSRKLRVDKLIEGRTTFIRLAGDLDDSFPRDKLAEGLEGQVIIELSSVNRIEPAGAAEWRGLMQVATPLVEQLYLAGVPPAFLEKLCTPEDLGPKAQVVTLTLPYACPSCGITSGQLIDVGAEHEVLAFATAPELRCTTCKVALTCVAGEATMTMLPGLPRPSASAELVKGIEFLRTRAAALVRKPEVKTPAGGPVRPTLVARTGLLVPFLAALLAIVVAAGGYIVYQRVTGTDPSAGGALTARSAQARPAWITVDSPGTAHCDEIATGLSCVGVSTRVARQDEAEDEAADSAYDALANAIAVRIKDPSWQATVVPIYQGAREAKLATLDGSPGQTTARREVREARRAVAQALRATSGGAVGPPVGRYWEAYGDADGKRFQAFAQVTLGATEIAKLAGDYTRSASALGATVVPAFPLIAWRHPKLERGAVVVGLDSGVLMGMGLAEQYVVLGIGGRDVNDATSFAKLANDEHTQLAARGGTLRLKVQTADPAPREFTSAIKPPNAPDPDKKRPTIIIVPGGGGNPGGINVWDKYGGGKGGRDDPSQ